MDCDEAFVEGVKTFRDAEGFIDPEKYQDHIDSAAETIENKLVDSGRKYTRSDASVASDPFSRMFVLNNYNLSRTDIKSALTQMSRMQSGMSAGTWSNFIQDALKPVYEKISRVPLTYLKPEDAGDVIKKVDPKGRYSLDPTAEVWKETTNLAIILNPYIAAGCPTGDDYNVFTPQFLHEHRRLFEEGRRKGSVIVPPPGSSIENFA